MNIKKMSYILVVLFLAVLIKFSHSSYKYYENTIIVQQQEHLMTICKSIIRGLELYFEEKCRLVENVCKNIQTSYEVDPLVEAEAIIRRLSYANNNLRNEFEYFQIHDLTGVLQGEYLGRYSSNFEQVDILELRASKRSLKVIKGINNRILYIRISVPITRYNKLIGFLTAYIPIENIYKKVVEPIRAGEYGHARVKDKNGLILMHPVENQVGLEVIEERKVLYPQLDLRDLELVMERQLRGEEGTATYYSYWWDNKLNKEKKISAFAPFEFEQLDWVVSVPMSYDEISQPVKNYLNSIMLISLVIIGIFTFAVYVILRLKKDKDKAHIEMNYLRILRKNDLELQHSRRLKMIGTLTSGISHEFNNLLTPVLGFSERLLTKLKPEDNGYEDALAIHDAAMRTTEIIDKIMTFSRKGNQPSQYNWIDIKDFADKTFKIVRQSIPDTIKVTLDYEDAHGNVWGNETELLEVVINICKNAYQAIDHNEGFININFTVLTNDQDLLKDIVMDKEVLKISIQDNGKGMSEETKQHIFEPFFTLKKTGEGTGLGLSLVYQMVIEHGGNIQVNSQEHLGSTFEVYIPMSDTSENKYEEVYQTQEDKTIKNTSILVFDQDKSIVHSVAKGLESYGYDVKGATDLLQFNASVVQESNQFDVLIVNDFELGEEPIDQLGQIRKKLSGSKIIVMSSFDRNNVKTLLQTGLIDDYILKPFTINKLIQTIQQNIKTVTDEEKEEEI